MQIIDFVDEVSRLWIPMTEEACSSVGFYLVKLGNRRSDFKLFFTSFALKGLTRQLKPEAKYNGPRQ